MARRRTRRFRHRDRNYCWLTTQGGTFMNELPGGEVTTTALVADHASLLPGYVAADTRGGEITLMRCVGNIHVVHASNGATQGTRVAQTQPFTVSAYIAKFVGDETAEDPNGSSEEDTLWTDDYSGLVTIPAVTSNMLSVIEGGEYHAHLDFKVRRRLSAEDNLSLVVYYQCGLNSDANGALGSLGATLVHSFRTLWLLP